MGFALIGRITPYFIEAAWMSIAIPALVFALGMALAALVTAADLGEPAAARTGHRLRQRLSCHACLVQRSFGGPEIGINSAADMSEPMRGAILAVDRRQNEAARTIGFDRIPAMRYVILPLGVNTVALIRGSALVSAISVVELTYTAQRYISSTYKPFDVFAVAALLYVVIIVAVTMLIRWVDQRFAIQ